GETSVLDRREAQAVRAAPDARTLLHLFAGDVTEVVERVRPMYEVVRTAAAVDPELAGVLAEMDGYRMAHMREVAGWLADRAALGLEVERAAEIIWTLTSPDVARMLRDSCGWSAAQHAAWLEAALTSTLLAWRRAPKTGVRGRAVAFATRLRAPSWGAVRCAGPAVPLRRLRPSGCRRRWRHPEAQLDSVPPGGSGPIRRPRDGPGDRSSEASIAAHPGAGRDVASLKRAGGSWLCAVSPFPPETHYVEVNGAQVGYQVIGAGPIDLGMNNGLGSHNDLRLHLPPTAP